MQSTSKLTFRLIFLVFITALVYGLFRAEPPPHLFTYFDKALHAVAMFLAVVGARVVFRASSSVGFGLITLAIAAILEPLQGWLVVTRHMSYEDGAANIAGVAIALVLVSFWRPTLSSNPP